MSQLIVPTSGETRVVDRVAPIDYDAIRRFFDGRAARSDELDPVSVILLQDGEDDLACRRDVAEVEQMLPLLLDDGFADAVLDIGCGVGRWGAHLAGHIGSYLGIDFSPGLVDLANRLLGQVYPDGSATALPLGAQELCDPAVVAAGPFDLVLLSGVLVYLNDDDCEWVLQALPDRCAPGARVYLREPMGIEGRLTLCNHWSDELQSTYNAVYRTPDEYRELIAAHLEPQGFSVTADFPFAPELRNRVETAPHVMVMTMSDDR